MHRAQPLFNLGGLFGDDGGDVPAPPPPPQTETEDIKKRKKAERDAISSWLESQEDNENQFRKPPTGLNLPGN